MPVTALRKGLSPGFVEAMMLVQQQKRERIRRKIRERDQGERDLQVSAIRTEDDARVSTSDESVVSPSHSPKRIKPFSPSTEKSHLDSPSPRADTPSQTSPSFTDAKATGQSRTQTRSESQQGQNSGQKSQTVQRTKMAASKGSKRSKVGAAKNTIGSRGVAGESSRQASNLEEKSEVSNAQTTQDSLPVYGTTASTHSAHVPPSQSAARDLDVSLAPQIGEARQTSLSRSANQLEQRFIARASPEKAKKAGAVQSEQDECKMSEGRTNKADQTIGSPRKTSQICTTSELEQTSDYALDTAASLVDNLKGENDSSTRRPQQHHIPTQKRRHKDSVSTPGDQISGLSLSSSQHIDQVHGASVPERDTRPTDQIPHTQWRGVGPETENRPGPDSEPIPAMVTADLGFNVRGNRVLGDDFSIGSSETNQEERRSHTNLNEPDVLDENKVSATSEANDEPGIRGNAVNDQTSPVQLARKFFQAAESQKFEQMSPSLERSRASSEFKVRESGGGVVLQANRRHEAQRFGPNDDEATPSHAEQLEMALFGKDLSNFGQPPIAPSSVRTPAHADWMSTSTSTVPELAKQDAGRMFGIGAVLQQRTEPHAVPNQQVSHTSQTDTAQPNIGSTRVARDGWNPQPSSLGGHHRNRMAPSHSSTQDIGLSLGSDAQAGRNDIEESAQSHSSWHEMPCRDVDEAEEGWAVSSWNCSPVAQASRSSGPISPEEAEQENLISGHQDDLSPDCFSLREIYDPSVHEEESMRTGSKPGQSKSFSPNKPGMDEKHDWNGTANAQSLEPHSRPASATAHQLSNADPVSNQEGSESSPSKDIERNSPSYASNDISSSPAPHSQSHYVTSPYRQTYGRTRRNEAELSFAAPARSVLSRSSASVRSRQETQSALSSTTSRMTRAPNAALAHSGLAYLNFHFPQRRRFQCGDPLL